MGYRVGVQCVATELQANDLVLSSLPPVVLIDGTVIRPVRTESGWFMGGQEIKLSYPPCDQIEQVQSGAEIGVAVIAVILAVTGFRWLIGMVKDMFKPVGESE